MNRLIDSHAHLNGAAFDADREAVVAASARELDSVIDVATDEATARVSLELSKMSERIFTAIGVGPHDARLFDEVRLDRVLELARGPKVVALGEMGLDFHHDFSPRSDQVRIFSLQVERARNGRLPIILHIREAFETAFAILAEGKVPPGVLHCFTGTWEEARRGLDLGFYVSFSGIVTFKNGERLREVARQVPIDRLLVETDAPYLTPHPYRNVKRNSPPMVRHTAELIARVRGLELDELARRTSENARRLFGLVEAGSIELAGRGHARPTAGRAGAHVDPGTAVPGDPARPPSSGSPTLSRRLSRCSV